MEQKWGDPLGRAIRVHWRGRSGNSTSHRSIRTLTTHAHTSSHPHVHNSTKALGHICSATRAGMQDAGWKMQVNLTLSVKRRLERSLNDRLFAHSLTWHETNRDGLNFLTQVTYPLLSNGCSHELQLARRAKRKKNIPVISFTPMKQVHLPTIHKDQGESQLPVTT